MKNLMIILGLAASFTALASTKEIACRGKEIKPSFHAILQSNTYSIKLNNPNVSYGFGSGKPSSRFVCTESKSILDIQCKGFLENSYGVSAHFKQLDTKLIMILTLDNSIEEEIWECLVW